MTPPIDVTGRLAFRPVEVAKVMGMSRTRIYELIHAGKLPAFRVGGSILISAEVLKQWMTEQPPVAEVAAPLYTR